MCHGGALHDSALCDALTPVSILFAPVYAMLAGSYLLCSTSQSAYPKNYRHEDGGVYNGQWQGKNKQGLGSYQYPGGAKYEGEWRNNCKEYRDVYTFPKGSSYKGEWRGGERDCEGIRTRRSGKVLAGRWQQDHLAVPMEEWQCALAVETAHHAARAAKRVPVGQGELEVALQQVLISYVLLATLAGMLLNVLQLSPPPTWQDVCEATAARYVPTLLLLVGVLSLVALPGAALPLFSPGAAVVTMVISIAITSPVPIEERSRLRKLGLLTYTWYIL
ncbi:TPA: hypothetical protein ACH3X1_011227 [Trebouxia sp. C0004]